MRKSPIKSALIDLFHKGFVYTCIGVTIYGCSYIGYRYYRYVTREKPKILLENQKLLAEGSSEVIKDNAETLKL